MTIFILLIITSLVLVFIISELLYFVTEPNDTKNVTYESIIHNYTFEKIDNLLEGMGDYKPDKVIVGSHYWNKIPNFVKYEPVWERKGKQAYGLSTHGRTIKTFEKKKCVDYKGIKILFDEDNKYRFDIE